MAKVHEGRKKSSRPLPRTAYAIAATGTAFDNTFVFSGDVFSGYILECYDSTNNVTRTLSIIDSNSVTVWSGAAHVDAANTGLVPVDIDLDGTYTFRLTLSGAAGGTGGTDNCSARQCTD